MKKTLRSAAKTARKAPVRRPAKKAPVEMSPDEVVHLEQISLRYAQAESAWQRMTAPPDGDDAWNKVEEHLLRGAADQDRRWKYFAK